MIVCTLLVYIGLVAFTGSGSFGNLYKIRKQIKAAIIESGVPENQFYDCMNWAFSDKWKSTPFRNFPDKWNERHSDIFLMYGHDNQTETLMKVGKAYLER